MIPRDYITAWRAEAPWVQDFQIEQDLIISRALVEIFSNPTLAEALAFRGGTALYKLYVTPAPRYSEDIDLVQVRAEPAAPMMSALREILDPWLGKPQGKQAEGRVSFAYRVDSEDVPPMRLRLKLEINSREHLSVFGFTNRSFSVDSRWFSGTAEIHSFELDELPSGILGHGLKETRRIPRRQYRVPATPIPAIPTSVKNNWPLMTFFHICSERRDSLPIEGLLGRFLPAAGTSDRDPKPLITLGKGNEFHASP